MEFEIHFEMKTYFVLFHVALMGHEDENKLTECISQFSCE